jgi:hypothetical protein
MAVRKPFFNNGSTLTEMSPTADTLTVSVPTANNQPAVFQQVASSTYFVGQMVTGRVSGAANTTLALPANQLQAYPIRILRAITISTLSTIITTAAAGSTFRVGIYNDNGSLYPSTLVTGSDAGLMVGTATGAQATNLSPAITLQPGLYWLAICTNVSFTIRALALGAVSSILGDLTALGASSGATGRAISFTFAAMPTTFPATASLISSAPALIGLTVSAVA